VREEEHIVTEDMVITLVKKSQNGDLRAFEQLVEQYYSKIYNIALGMMGSSHEAEDAAQNVLIKIYRSIDGFRHQSKFSTWVYRITSNVCMDELRKKKRTKAVSTDDIGDSAYDIENDNSNISPEGLILSSERKAVLYDAINRLKNEHKQVIVLRDINGFSYTEMAKILKCSEGTVKSRISRARGALKNILEENGYFR